MSLFRVFFPPLLGLIAVFPLSQAKADTHHQVQQPVAQAVDTRKKTQHQEEQWREEQEQLTAQYELLRQELQELTKQRQILNNAVAATGERLAGKKRQLAEITRISNEIKPYLTTLFNQLSETQESGPPFHQVERANRLIKLEAMMADPSITVGEQYRRLMEALMIEAEYGYTTEVYREHLDLAGQDTLVDIFRLGRLNLFYLTLDQGQCGFFNEATQQWQALDNQYLPAIESAVAIAGKRQPAEILSLPLGRLVRQ